MREKTALLRERVSRLPRISLTQLPTPMQECPRFSEALGGGVRILMKRDDLMTVGLGGNKVRKLEFSLGKAKAEGYDAIVHGLAGQSNYCRLTAAACAMTGLPCHLVLRWDHKAGDPPQGNRLLDYVFGAEVIMASSREEQSQAKAELVEKLRSEGKKPYVIGYHDEVLGAAGYSLCMAEMMEQMSAMGASADYVCVTGNAGTQAGLVLGKRLLGFGGEIMGFTPAPVEDESAVRARTAKIAGDAAALLGVEERFSPEEIHNTSAYGGEQYGKETRECVEALGLLGRTEGVVAGPVYTGKGLAGLIDYVRRGKIAAGKTAAFVHTGGTPELFAYNAEVAEVLLERAKS